ncbi:MAG: ABC transporter ATP-binding protein [Clostridia bacterium]|nr:ABC transporter ATP-binding protein [Clostridia bacterium]
MKTVIKYLRPVLFPVIICLLVKASSSLTELAIPRMLEIVIDVNVKENDINAVWQNGAIMLFFAVLTFILNVIGNRIAAFATGRFSRDLRHDLFVSTLNLDAEATDRLGLSSLTSRITVDTYNVTGFFARLQRIGIKAPLTLIAGIVITMTIDVRYALILLGVMPLVCITVYVISKHSIPIYTEEQTVLDGIVRRVDETASGIRVIKALSKTEYEKARFSERVHTLAKKEVEAGRLMSATKPINDFIFYLGFCLVILVGALLAMNGGAAEPGKLMTFMTYFTIILNNTIMVTRVFVQGSRAVASAARIEEVILEKPTVTLREANEGITTDDNYIVFDNVTFSYNKKRPDLDHVSFGIGKGETLGIIGATGSGKSTVVHLLIRLYDPDSGEIRIGGRPITTIPKDEMNAMFGVAFQNDFIPAMSIGENVSFFRNLSDDDVSSAVDFAMAREFVNELPENLSYGVTTRGTNISGGQKQRLLIARAVAADPEILVLDDSSSALDYKTDAELRRHIAERVGKTTVIVSQRIASVMHADKIAVMDGGRLIGFGTHTELMRDLAEYRDIAEVQLG